MKLSEVQGISDLLQSKSSPAQREEILQHLQQVGAEPRNLYQELEMESRFVDTHRDESSSGSSVQLHSHSFCEILYCRNTCGVEYLVGSERYRIQRGDIIMVAPGISHRPLFPEQMAEPYRRDVIWIDAEYLKALKTRFVGNDIPQSSLLRTAGTRWEILGAYFRRGVEEAARREPGWEMAVLGNTLQILTCLYRAGQDRAAMSLTAETPELLEQVMAYVERNLGKKITLGDIAHQFYVSESTITQLFRQKLGVSFHRCLTQRRLIAAKSLMESGAALEDVSRQVGFADYSSFYRAFRQEYGISPRQYRKRRTGEEAADSGLFRAEPL